jgi:hypothetical protein
VYTRNAGASASRCGRHDHAPPPTPWSNITPGARGLPSTCKAPPEGNATTRDSSTFRVFALENNKARRASLVAVASQVAPRPGVGDDDASYRSSSGRAPIADERGLQRRRVKILCADEIYGVGDGDGDDFVFL